MPMTVSSTLNCERMPAAERLDEPFPIFAFSTTVTRNPRSANRTDVKAPDAPPRSALHALRTAQKRGYYSQQAPLSAQDRNDLSTIGYNMWCEEGKFPRLADPPSLAGGLEGWLAFFTSSASRILPGRAVMRYSVL